MLLLPLMVGLITGCSAPTEEVPAVAATSPPEENALEAVTPAARQTDTPVVETSEPPELTAVPVTGVEEELAAVTQKAFFAAEQIRQFVLR